MGQQETWTRAFGTPETPPWQKGSARPVLSLCWQVPPSLQWADQQESARMHGGLWTSPPTKVPSKPAQRSEMRPATKPSRGNTRYAKATGQRPQDKRRHKAVSLHPCSARARQVEKWEKVGYFKLPFVMTPFDSPQLCEKPPFPFPKPAFQLAKPIEPREKSKSRIKAFSPKDAETC